MTGSFSSSSSLSPASRWLSPTSTLTTAAARVRASASRGNRRMRSPRNYDCSYRLDNLVYCYHTEYRRKSYLNSVQRKLVCRLCACTTCRLRFSYKTLFWTLFGYGDYDAADVVVHYLPEHTDSNETLMNGTTATMATESHELVKHTVATSLWPLITHLLVHQYVPDTHC